MSEGKVYRDRNLRMVFLVTLMAVMGVSAITPAFPGVVSELDIDRSEIGLLITVFTLPGIVLTPILGIAADRLGRKRVLVPSLLVFGLFGGACMFARDLDTLLLLRFLQGIGAGALGSMNVTLIGDLFKGGDCVAAMGYNSAILSVGTASYPFIGGLLAEAEWYYPFGLPFLAIPVGIVVLLFLASPEPHFDSELGEYLNEAWKDLRSREVMALLLASVSSFIIVFGSVLSFAPILMGERFGSSSALIGAMLSLMSVTTAIASSRLVFFARRLSERRTILIAFFLYGTALISVPLIDALYLLTIPLAVMGFAQGISYPTIQTLFSRKASTEYRAAFMSSNGMALRLGQTIGPLLMGSALAYGGLDAPFMVGGAVAMVTFVLMFILFEGNVRICDIANDLYRPLE